MARCQREELMADPRGWAPSVLPIALVWCASCASAEEQPVVLYEFDCGAIEVASVAAFGLAEDETDVSRVHVRLPVFEALARGFLEQTGDVLTDDERDLLPFAGILLSYEVAVRFLTDFLEGDVYFRTSRPGQNLDRTRAQLALVAALEDDEAALRRAVERASEPDR